MIVTLALILAIVSLGTSVVLALKVSQLSAMYAAKSNVPIQTYGPAVVDILEEPVSRPLEGLRIGIAVTQDHPHAVLVDLLKEQLYAEDVTDIVVLSPSDVSALVADWNDREDAPDILINGDLVCNGYAEIYYSADFTCVNRTHAICMVIEKPPHGDRPANLAIELVSRLKKELEKLVGRNDRRQAIGELKS